MYFFLTGGAAPGLIMHCLIHSSTHSSHPNHNPNPKPFRKNKSRRMFHLNTKSIMRRDHDRHDRRDDDRRGYDRGDDNRGNKRGENFRDDNRGRNEGLFENPRSLHEQEHGNNSDRGNYRTDSHFNEGYGRRGDITSTTTTRADSTAAMDGVTGTKKPVSGR